MTNNSVLSVSVSLLGTELTLFTPSEAYVGDTVNIAGVLTVLGDPAAGIPGKKVTLTWWKPNGLVRTASFSPTLEHGEHYWGFYVDMEGTFTFQTSFAGDADFEACVSTLHYLTAAIPPPVRKKTVLTIDGSTAVGMGEKTFVWGQLLDLITNQGLNGKTVTLNGVKPNGTPFSQNMQTYPDPITGFFGFYLFEITIDQTGQWVFQTSFAGDVEYEGCEEQDFG